MSETSTIKSRSFYQALALLSIYARLRASLAKLDEGEFTEGHELDRKWRVRAASTWPLAVRFLVITSSTTQNFEANA